MALITKTKNGLHKSKLFGEIDSVQLILKGIFTTITA